MKKILFILISLVIFGCSSDRSHETDLTMESHKVAEDVEAPRNLAPSSSPEQHLEKGSKIIKTGNMSFEVSNLKKSKATIDSLLKSASGYYENEQYKSYGNRISYSLKIRTPSAKFDSMIAALEYGIRELQTKNISAQDVTEEYVDLGIRLENNLVYLKQYQTILLKAKSIKEILEVQEKIRYIQEEIESKKGRLKYLDNNVNYATLSLEISELISREITNQPHYGRKLLNAFNNGVQGFLSIFVTLVNVWPIVLFLVVVFLSRGQIKRRFRK